MLICGDRGKIKGDALENLTILERLLPTVDTLNPDGPDSALTLTSWLGQTDFIVDALFGTGLRGPLTEKWSHMINTINALNKPVLAVDIPSGLDCDTGEPLGAAIRAKCTVSFVAMKTGFTTPKAQAYTGNVLVASIGVTPLVKEG